MRRVHEKVDLDVRANWFVVREDRETGEILGREKIGSNSIPNAGKSLILDLMANLSTSHLDNANAIIEFDLSSGAASVEGSSCVSGYPTFDTGVSPNVVRWRWEDVSTETYTISTIRMRQGSTTGTILSEVSSPFTDNSKPSSENWYYELEFDISSSNSNFHQAGLEEILRQIADLHGDHYGGPASMTVSSTQLITGDFSAANTNSAISNCDSGYPSRSSQTLTYRWTSAAGSNDTYAWTDVRVEGAPWSSGNQALSTDVGASHGTKGSNEEWQYTYDFSI